MSNDYTNKPRIDILIADDAALFRNFVKDSVKMVKLEANFIEVAKGKDLFPRYEKYVPEIAIVDGYLEGIDVFDTVKKIIELHPIASIILSVNSIRHSFMKQALQIGIKKVIVKTTDQFTLGSLIKKIVSDKISKLPEYKKIIQQNTINDLTVATLTDSKNTKNQIRKINQSIQKSLQKITKLKSLGDDFSDTIKHLHNVSETRPSTSPYFFMRESNESLIKLLNQKNRELQQEKQFSEQLNKKLQNALYDLEKTSRILQNQNENLEKQVQEKSREIIKFEKMRTLGLLSARVAHDLRNPLSVIKNTVEILHMILENYHKEETEKHWKRLDRAIYRMSHQLEDVMDFLRKAPLQRRYAKLSTILQDAIDRIPFPENISFHQLIDDVDVFCDDEKLEVVFVNLISNSIQALNGKDGDIWVKTLDKKDSLQIQIIDNGPGIPSNLISKIFDPLFTTRQIGTGLVLSSCKNIIELHKGSLFVSSIEGQGATFTIVLPKSEWEQIDDYSIRSNKIT